MGRLSSAILFIIISLGCSAADFSDYFTDNTIRLDVSVEREPGSKGSLDIDSVSVWPGWYGRRANLTNELYPQEIQVVVIDQASGDTIYVDSKNSNALAEPPHPGADIIQVFVPKPLRDSRIVANLYGYDSDKRRPWLMGDTIYTAAQLTAMQPRECVSDYRTLHAAKDEKHCVNIAIVSEGYTIDEAEKFYRRAQMLDSALFVQPAFKNIANYINLVAVMLYSPESGVSVPSEQKWVRSALGAHFDSFGMERLVTIRDTKSLWDALEGVPVSQVIILANTEKYGGSGAFNEYAIGAAHIDHFEEVVIHEFGHSFVGLGDEYESGFDDLYSSDFEPIEPNITTLNNFSGKWQNLIDDGQASLIEGGGYQAKGVWRGCEKCLMRAIEDHDFCAVCSQAVARMIQYYLYE